MSLLQNILKRTTPGSRDEDTATKAFNELKKVEQPILPKLFCCFFSVLMFIYEHCSGNKNSLYQTELTEGKELLCMLKNQKFISIVTVDQGM